MQKDEIIKRLRDIKSQVESERYIKDLLTELIEDIRGFKSIQIQI